MAVEELYLNWYHYTEKPGNASRMNIVSERLLTTAGDIVSCLITKCKPIPLLRRGVNEITGQLIIRLFKLIMIPQS